MDPIGEFQGCAGFALFRRCLNTLTRRKQVDSVLAMPARGPRLANSLSVPHLISIGIGSTIGAGVYILIGTVAREHSGPSLPFSFLIAGIAAALSAFCYAELSSRCPAAGSAYHYSYIFAGELVAWMIGWALLLEYTLGAASVARGISPNLALFFGGENNLPVYISRHKLPWFDIVVDPCGAVLVLIMAGLLCLGIKESTTAQGVATSLNICVMLFIVAAGSYLGFSHDWPGYHLPTGYFPYGVNGMLTGSATVFFAFIGFDIIASAAEETKNPQTDLPTGIGVAVTMCCMLYMLVSVVVVGLVPYQDMNVGTPISSAFATNGMAWAAYVVAAGATMALFSTLIGSLIPQPRIMMAMARDGLLPEFVCDVNRRTRVPVKATLLIGALAAVLAFFLDVSQLAGMVSVGALSAFSTVAVSVLILRYVTPAQVPFPSSRIDTIRLVRDENATVSPLLQDDEFLEKSKCKIKLNEKDRRVLAGWTIALICLTSFIITLFSSNSSFSSDFRLSICGAGGTFLIIGTAVLTCIEQDQGREKFGSAGGYNCPFIPFLPICCIVINFYLLVNLGHGTWIRVSVWLVLGVLVYVVYGRTHSSLVDVVYVPIDHADENHLRP